MDLVDRPALGQCLQMAAQPGERDFRSANPIMSANEQLHPEYITDGDGNRKCLILPIGEYEQLLEDLEDLAAVAERRDEPVVSHEALLEELKADGLLPD